jgi:DNA-binding IclR family transcriptional regulator
MAAPVPAVERANRILQVLACQPGESLTATEVATAVGIHRATCFSILACLAETGLVHRDEATKTYRLGPELIRLGTAARYQHPGLAAARREMCRLAVELGVGGLICVLIGDEIVVLERIGEHDEAFGLPAVEHTRARFAPPLGGIFVAWSGPEAIDGWLSRARPTATAGDLESYRRSLAAIRSRGWSIGSQADVELQIQELVAKLESGDDGERLAVALELADFVRQGRPAPARPSGHLVAPVFDDQGEVAMTLTLYGRHNQIADGNVSAYADALVAAADRVTHEAGGRWRL